MGQLQTCLKNSKKQIFKSKKEPESKPEETVLPEGKAEETKNVEETKLDTLEEEKATEVVEEKGEEKEEGKESWTRIKWWELVNELNCFWKSIFTYVDTSF